MLGLVVLRMMLTLGTVSAQTTYNQTGFLWQRYYFKGRLSEKLMLHVETERRSLKATRYTMQRLLPRVHVHYAMNPKMDVGFGVSHFLNYGVIPERNENFVGRSELRLHQELNLSQPFGLFRFNHRYQVEERLYMPYSDPQYAPTAVGLEFGLRFRYQLQMEVRLTPTNKKVGVFFKLFDELLLQVSEARPYQLFEANRFYGGVNVKFSEVWALEAGYLVWIQQKTHSDYTVPHIARLTLYHSIDFRKRKADV